MTLTTAAIRLLILTLLSNGVVHPQKPCQPALPSVPQRDFTTDAAGKNLLIVSDNQEQNMTGVRLRLMGVLSDRILTSVAMRPPLAHVGGRLLLREILQFGKERKADLVLHLGDAANISCADELTSVFDLLNKEAKGIWFMAPGNHDGMLLGTIANKQPTLNYKIREDESTRTAYNRKPSAGLGYKDRGWPSACLSPKNLEQTLQSAPTNSPNDTNMLEKGILTRGDALGLYLKELKDRDGFSPISQGTEETIVEGTSVICDVEEIAIASYRYAAIASICRPTERRKGSNDWVGPFASYIIQKLEIRGTTIVLLDTSDYQNPSLFNVALEGGLTRNQRARAEEWFKSLKRENVIIAGHHPIDDFPKEQERWIIKNAARYISGHVHRSTQLINHKDKQLKTLELNVGSTIDYPPQAVIARVTSPASMSFEVTGAKSGLPGFLRQCLANDGWTLERSHYRDYRRGTYVNRLLDSLEKASAKHIALVGPLMPHFEIPKGNNPNDWRLLETALEKINAAEGDSRAFWACQAYYASEATQGKSTWESIRHGIGRDTKSGCDATGSRFAFSAL